MSQGQLEINYEAARKARSAFDDAQEDLETNASTMPSSGSYGGSPGKRLDEGTADEKSAWESANNDYESYLEKKLFDKLSTKVPKAHKKLTDWAAEHMTVSPDSPLFELTTKSLQDGAIKFAEHGIENVYYGHAFDALARKAIPTATKRAALKSDNPQKKRGRSHPIPIR